MNNIDFTQTGGFPFDQGTLAFMQNNIVLASKAAAFGGTLSIISGCQIVGANTADGFVCINGEILPFVGGTITTKVIIVETVTNLLYEDNVSRPVQKVRHATFGDDGVTNYLWANFKRNTAEGVLARLERLEWLAAPLLSANATMLFWRKPSNVPLPVGWQEVVDWRGRLAMGHKPGTLGFAIGDIAGKEGHVMELANLIEHDHDYSRSQFGIGSELIDYARVDDSEGGGYDLWSHNKKTGKTGSANPTPIPTIPPVKMIMYIEPIPNYIP